LKIAKFKIFFKSGYTEVILKPVDLSIVLHKFDLYRTSQKTLKEDLLFRMDVDADVGLLLNTKVIQVSEFGAVLRSNMKLWMRGKYVVSIGGQAKSK
jgi:hypothetical protein